MSELRSENLLDLFIRQAVPNATASVPAAMATSDIHHVFQGFFILGTPCAIEHSQFGGCRYVGVFKRWKTKR